MFSYVERSCSFRPRRAATIWSIDPWVTGWVAALKALISSAKRTKPRTASRSLRLSFSRSSRVANYLQRIDSSANLLAVAAHSLDDSLLQVGVVRLHFVVVDETELA